MKHILSTFCLFAACGPLMAQNAVESTVRETVKDSIQVTENKALSQVPMKEIKGRIFDSATKQPAVGVSVSAYNDARYAAMTDENGIYVIKVPYYVTSLWLRADGYSSQQIGVGKGDAVVDSWMYSNTFGERYDNQTSAFSTKTVNVDYNNNDISIDGQMQMKLGGDVRTIMRSGVPGQGIAMFMNGLNSLNANAQPLVVIDGVITDMQLSRPSLHDGFFNNLFANIMVEDIEKISVMKNGTAIYGAKGANGVIIIETKRNKSMATKIDVSIGGSYELLPKQMDMMDAGQYRIYASELIGTTGTSSNSFKFLQTDPNYYYYQMYHNNTDWQKQVYEEAFTQNYSINVQGGDDVANYNLSVGYASADATLKNNSYSRFNLRLNSDIKLADNLNVRFDASYSDVTRDMRDDGVAANLNDGVISSPSFLSLIKAPFLSPYAFDSNGNVSSYMAGADDYLADVLPSKSYLNSLANPLAILSYGDGDNKNYFGNRLITLAITPKWNINKYWSIAEHFAFQLVNTDENYYLPVTGVPNFDVEGVGTVSNKVSALAGRQIVISSDSYFNYGRRFNAHTLNLRGGLRYIRDSYRLNTMIGYDSGNDKTPNMSSSLRNRTTDGTEDEIVDMTYYLTGEYNWAERYYLSAAVSMDGSSKFGVDAPNGVKIGNYAWGFFPSVEAAWVVTNESWMNQSWLNYLKINVGFDMVGNDDLDSKASRTYFIAKKLLNSAAGLTMGNIGNTRLQWETTTRWTAGLNFSVLNNRLSGSFNYFNSRTSDLLGLNTLSYISGLKNNWTNSGEMKNQGFDVSLQARLLDLKDWKWSAGATVGHYKNEITSLPASSGRFTTEAYGATILSQVGSPAGVFYGYKTAGVFATTAETEAAALYQEDEKGVKTYFQAGDMKFVDVDGNHRIDEADMQIIGDPNPDIYGNIFTNLSWKNLSLNVVFNYSLGNDVYNYQRSVLESGSRFYNQTTAMLRRWTTEGQQTDIPRTCYQDTPGNSRFSDRWIEDGSYLRLKNVTLSYYIPIRTTYLQGITVWGAANNLFTITRYLGNDPEFSASNDVLLQGIDRGLLAQGRNFSLGIKINL